MDSPLDSLDHVLFAVLPYVAAVTFLVLAAARRYRLPPFGSTQSPAPQTGGLQHYGERLLFGYGILVILGGHVLAFLIPDQVLFWNNEPVRLYVLEVSALVFGLMTLVGLVLTVGRCMITPEARHTTSPSDWVLYTLLLVQVASGIFVALFYWPGSSWYAISAVPYLRSVFMLDPDVSYIRAMPDLVKLHLVNAYLLLGFLPFTRLVRPLVVGPAAPLDDEQTRSGSYLTTIVLLVGLAFSVVALVPRLESSHLPGNDQGYEPVQPIAFSHRLHAGELKMACLYCHSQAEKSPHAGIPAASVCMNCHYYVTAPIRDVRAETELAERKKRPPRPVISAELKKLYAALGLDDELKPDSAKPSKPIRWVKVHNLPSFVRFDHRAHVNAGVGCERCHGLVETMERVRQVENLSMGWCVNCHREVNQTGVAGKRVRASNDCTTCHY
jgi:respiratory nitrate reductase gamma subunit